VGTLGGGQYLRDPLVADMAIRLDSDDAFLPYGVVEGVNAATGDFGLWAG
jgi:hypothetical protein